MVVYFPLNASDLHPPLQIQTFITFPFMFLLSQIIPVYAMSLLVILSVVL